MIWTNRVIRHRDGTFALHEAFYEGQKLWTITEDPVLSGGYESEDELRKDLANMLADATRLKALDVRTIRPSRRRRSSAK